MKGLKLQDFFFLTVKMDHFFGGGSGATGVWKVTKEC